MPEVYTATIREIPLSSIIGVGEGSRGRLAIIILTHVGSGINLLKGDQVGLGQLHLTLLVVCLIGVAAILVATLALGYHVHLAVSCLDVVGHHAELAHVSGVGVEIQSGVANRICNDSTGFALSRYTALKHRVAVVRLLLAHLAVIIRLLHPVVPGGPEVNQTLLVLILIERLVVRHRHFSSKCELLLYKYDLNLLI